VQREREREREREMAIKSFKNQRDFHVECFLKIDILIETDKKEKKEIYFACNLLYIAPAQTHSNAECCAKGNVM
jgi:hypothetical protein